MFGAGPTSLSAATTSNAAQVFVLDLASLNFKLDYAPKVLLTDEDESYVETFTGNFTAVDWTLNGATDAVYFGLAGGDALAPSGGVQRLSIDEAGDMAFSALLPTQSGQAFTAAPAAHTDRSGQRWVQVGSGRLFVAADNQSSTEQAFYALKESSDVDAVASDLVDVTGVDQDGAGAFNA